MTAAIVPPPSSRRSRASTLRLDRFPRHALTFGPSPIERLDRLTAHLGGRVEIFAKREDCNSGLAFGGNKLRKLEYLIPDALAQGCDTLVSIGGVQSNHTRQVAGAAAKLGLKCRLVQESWVNLHDAVYDRVGNIMLSRILGADVRLVDQGFDIGFRPSWEDAMEEVRRAGGKPYAIPAGASDHELGGLGFVHWAEEVRRQEDELGVTFDYVVVCSVTGSTQAGMVVGFAADGRADRVIGIDASAEPAKTRDQILRIAQRTAALVDLGRDITDADIVLDTRFAAPEYGLPSEGTLEAIRLSARLDGMLTDPVYEGKSMHGMIDLIREGTIPAGSRVLYAHLGGVPALNGYSSLFRNG
ncbi:1-aminocyclopropane-1-carboxylate deaminase [Methylobacterium oryzisoli]|uniref:1-aminocyclopropane-1-carboxylate deaminase n=1 Tax=Methylobacterium oryzisoli TaxID=3385502 RepID=UPI0038929C47